MNSTQLKELLLQSLVHERGGVLIYRTALECALNDDLKREWLHYLQQTERHVSILSNVCRTLGIDPGEMTPGCAIVQHTGKALISAMRAALGEGEPAAAQLVACESVLLAETKDHADWELLGQCAKALEGPGAQLLQAAYEEVGREEDEHLYHTQGWCRELWLESLGLDAVLPPPEETRDARSAAQAERAKRSRTGE